MTTVGHILVGTAVCIMALPSNSANDGAYKSRFFFLATFALLANIPDLPLPYWGHNSYHVSHSLFVNLLLACILAYGVKLKVNMTARALIAGVLAWMSHLLLDALYGDGLGVPVLWPLSDARAHLPLPWFSVITTGAEFSDEVKKQFTAEVLTYLPLVLVAYFFRRKMKNASAAQKS